MFPRGHSSRDCPRSNQIQFGPTPVVVERTAVKAAGEFWASLPPALASISAGIFAGFKASAGWTVRQLRRVGKGPRAASGR